MTNASSLAHRLVRRLLPSATAGALALAGLHLVSACVHDDETTSPDFPGVIFGAQTSDEALRALLSAQPVEDPTQAAYLTSPKTGLAQPTTLPLTFEWRVGPPSSRGPASMHDHRLARHTSRQSPSGETALSLLPRTEPTESLASSLLRQLAPIGLAHAHGSPVDGRAYFLVVTDANGEPVHQVFTTGFDNVVGEATREELALAPQPLRASVLNAVFERDAIIPGGGPWRGPAIELTLTIGP
jgi:hypothetical protein